MKVRSHGHVAVVCIQFARAYFSIEEQKREKKSTDSDLFARTVWGLYHCVPEKLYTDLTRKKPQGFDVR